MSIKGKKDVYEPFRSVHKCRSVSVYHWDDVTKLFLATVRLCFLKVRSPCCASYSLFLTAPNDLSAILSNRLDELLLE
jgi:hypothetical protein